MSIKKKYPYDKVHFNIDPELKARFNQKAKKIGVCKSHVIRKAIIDFVKD